MISESSVTDTLATVLKGDRPLQQRNEDKLGFRAVAMQIATALVEHRTYGGLVVGLEGSWGSGKSSLLFLIEDELERRPKDQRPTVINFRPWLIGNRDALLTALFSSLALSIEQVANDAGGASRASKSKAKEAAAALWRFTVALSKAGALVEVVGDASGFMPLKWAGSCLRAVSRYIRKKPADPTLGELKDNLITALRSLGHRFVVIIDDVDRLEPKEVIEILRLTRSVGDFPNVIYILSYDSDVLAHNVEQATQVESGFSYLEKIVQLSVMVPTPEPFQLRQWFGEELHNIASTKNDNELSRLKTVIDYDGGRYLRTPRSVVRVLDSIRFLWPPLQKKGADLADLVWLQIIKNGSPDLYRWIEEYCATASVLALGSATVGENKRQRDLERLIQADKSQHFDDEIYRHCFSEHLPGVRANFLKKEGLFELYQPVNDTDLSSAISNAKLASPDHYRLYFALSGPSHALTHADFQAMWSAADEGSAKVEALILKWHDENASGALGKADLLLERLKDVAPDALTPARSKILLVSFSNIMDEAYRIRPFKRGWVDSIWERAERLIPICLSQLGGSERQSAVDVMFKDGKAISWLSRLFRREIFAHGRYGARPRPEASWLFTKLELDTIAEIMLSRYGAMSEDEFLDVIDLTDLLFAWQQGGDADGPMRCVDSYIETDEGLIQILERLTSTINSSDRGMFQVLKRNNLSYFLDYDGAKSRVNALRADDALGARAVELSKAFEDGEEY